MESAVYREGGGSCDYHVIRLFKMHSLTFLTSKERLVDCVCLIVKKKQKTRQEFRKVQHCMVASSNWEN